MFLFSSQLPDIFRSKVGHHQFLHRFDAGRYLLLRLVKMAINRNELKEGQVALLLGIPCYVCYDFQRVTCLVGALLSQGEKTGETNETSEASKKNPTSKIHFGAPHQLCRKDTIGEVLDGTARKLKRLSLYAMKFCLRDMQLWILEFERMKSVWKYFEGLLFSRGCVLLEKRAKNISLPWCRTSLQNQLLLIKWIWYVVDP